MIYQRKIGWCGAATVCNALRCYNRKVTQRRVCLLAGGGSKEGLDEHDLIQALSALNHSTSTISTDKESDAIGTLQFEARSHPVIISAEKEDHWVVVIGVLGDRFILFDSNRTLRNKAENGVQVLTPGKLARYWVGKGGKYFGIVVGPKIEVKEE